METKNCLCCKKIMKFEDYKLYKSYPEKYFIKRKWCSEECRLKNCSKKQYERKKWNLELEHNQKILKANEIINGEIVGINGGNKILSDIKKNNQSWEVEVVGNTAFRKFKEKYTKDNSKDTNLVICLRRDNYFLFNEVYFMKENGEFIKLN